MDIGQARMVQFPPLGLEIPEDHPDRNKYFSISLRKRQVNPSDVAEITLMSPATYSSFIPTESTTALMMRNDLSLSASCEIRKTSQPAKFVARCLTMPSSAMNAYSKSVKLM
jgi:hypothetical protein